MDSMNESSLSQSMDTILSIQSVVLEQQTHTTVKKKSIAERIPAFGVLMALISVFCFSLSSVIVKVITDLNSIEILVIRCIFQLIFYTSSTLINRYAFFGQSGHRLDLAMRCISGSISLNCLYTAYRLMPIADASTIHFASPVFVTVFAYFMLKEVITVTQVLTGIITLIGVVVIAKPDFIFGSQSQDMYDQRLLGTILAVVAAITAAFSMVNLRKLRTTPSSVVVMWYSITVIVSGLVILTILNQLVWPTGLKTWLLLLAIGLCGIGDQYFLTVALQHESAAPVSVTRTFNIVLTFIWEVVILSEAIELTSFIGAAIISSCVIILAAEKWLTERSDLLEKLLLKFGLSSVSDEKSDCASNNSKH